MKTLNEQLERLRELVRKCYGAVASKGGTIPEAGERNMENLPTAVASVPQVVGGVQLELVATENHKDYLPDDYGVDAFSKVTTEIEVSIPKIKVAGTLQVSNDCIGDDGRWNGESIIDTSECTSFANLFKDCNKLTSLNIKDWNTSKVTNIQYAFQNCSYLSLDLSGWDTSNLKNAYYFIYRTNGKLMEELDITGWNASKLTDIYMFSSNSWLTTLIGNKTIDDVIANNIYILKDLKISLAYLNQFRKLDRASLRALINGLADLTDQTSLTLNFGADVISKLTEEDIAIATSKNWTIA